MAWLPIATTVGSALLQNGANQSAQQAQSDAQARALAQYLGIDVPDIVDQQLNLQQYQSAGTLDPALEQALTQGDTALAGVSTDPSLRQSQMEALQSIAGLASGNPSQADLAGYELARQNSAAEMQAKQNQILQEMQQRGQAGSGAELLAKLTGAQSGTQMLQQAQLQQAKDMQAARLAALAQQSNMASNVRNQDYSEAANTAKARDAIAQFNAQNSQAVNSRNTAAKNTAQAANLANAQQIANSNTGTMNSQQQYNKQLQQQQFQNQMNLAAAKAGQYNAQGTAAAQQGANQSAMIGQIGQGLNTALSGYFNSPDNKSTAPTNNGVSAQVTQFDPNKFTP